MQNLSTFIQQNPNKKPSELVSLAKEKGLTLSEHYIAGVRWRDKTKGEKKSKRGLPKLRAAAGTGSEFIRKHPNVVAADLVLLGKKKGYTFTSSLVYQVRHQERSKGIVKRSSAPRPTKLGPNPFTAAEKKWLQGTIHEVGVNRARELLDTFEVRLDTILKKTFGG